MSFDYLKNLKLNPILKINIIRLASMAKISTTPDGVHTKTLHYCDPRGMKYTNHHCLPRLYPNLTIYTVLRTPHPIGGSTTASISPKMPKHLNTAPHNF